MNRRLLCVGVFGGLATLLTTIHIFAQQEVELREIGPKVTEFVNENPLTETDEDTELQKVLKQKHNAALAEMQIRYAEYRGGVEPDSESIFDASIRLLDAKLELTEAAEDKRAVLQRFIELNKEFETLATNRVAYGGDSKANLERLRYERLRYEAELLRL